MGCGVGGVGLWVCGGGVWVREEVCVGCGEEDDGVDGTGWGGGWWCEGGGARW